ncbi:MAG: hypothetical protein BJ554DRAFT_8031 [Olpidium bornovanus]|uniref:Guanylate cyclase domain-containing protein n=1 Tax=Olpidium bornovanus TaxID=278681 RepID=A0A8H8DIM3_9FUNG|nr:MAG: hypothetical protein BJ554DRAFT_8031 [Olpidium bornovanus]
MDDPMTEEELAVEKGEIVLKACDCCLEMLIKLGQFKIDIPGCNIHLLKIHLGIGAGQIFDVHVGGMPGRWEHFIAGDAVHQLANVLDIAKAGELAVSLPALRWFQEVIELGKSDVAYYNKRCILLHGLEKRTRKAYGRLHSDNSMMALWDINGRTSPLAQYLYKMYINENAQFKLQTDLNQTALFRLNSRLNDLMGLNELRQVTTVFIKVGSLRFDSKDSLLETQEAMQAVQRALKRYQGSLRQFHVDDKGAVILVFFGLPPLAHESDASFGIKAGMEICVAFKQIFPDFAIGITTGVVSIGGVGNAVRTEYAVVRCPSEGKGASYHPP